MLRDRKISGLSAFSWVVLVLVLTLGLPSTALCADNATPAAAVDNNPIIQSALKVIKSSNNPLDTRKEMVCMILRLNVSASGKDPVLDPQAREHLLKILGDPADKQACMAVIEALAETQNPYPEFLPPLIKILLTAEPDLQTASSTALAIYRDKQFKLTEQLVQIANDTKRPTPQRLIAIETLGKIRSKTIVGALIDLMTAAVASKTEADEIAEACAKSLTSITRMDLGPNPAAWKKWWSVNSSKSTAFWLESQLDLVINENRDLRHRLEQTENAVISMAAQLFQMTAPNEADRVKVIQQYLSGTIPAQRRAGLELLTNSSAFKQTIPTALRAAVHDLIDDPDPQVRRACAKAMGECTDREAIPQLRNQLKTETDRDVKKAILIAFGQLGDKKQIDVLLQELNSEVEQVAIGASQAIATIFQDQKNVADGVQDQVIRALQARYTRATDEQVQIKQELLRAMGMTSDYRLAELYRKELASSSPDIRLYAARGLANLRVENQVDALLEQLRKESEPAVRAELAAGIASLTSDPKAVEDLLTRANPSFEKDNQVRQRTWDAVLVMITRWTLDQQLQWAKQLTLQRDRISQDQMATLADTIGAEIAEQTAPWPSDKKIDVLVYFGTFLLNTAHAEDSVKYFRQVISTTKQSSPERLLERTEYLLNVLLKCPDSETIVAQYLNALVGLLEPDQIESVMSGFAEWTSHPPNTRTASKICHSLSQDLLGNLPDNLRDRLEGLARKYKPSTSPTTNTPATGSGPS